MKELKNKFNLQGIINDVKSMINPAGNTPDADPSDAIGVKMAKLSVMVQELQQEYQSQGNKLLEINTLLNEVYRHLEALRGSNAGDDTAAAVDSKAAGDQGQDEKD